MRYRGSNAKIKPCPRKRRPTILPDDVLPVRNEGCAPMGSSARKIGGEGLERKGKRLHSLVLNNTGSRVRKGTLRFIL
jgi:hypothetical protein